MVEKVFCLISKFAHAEQSVKKKSNCTAEHKNEIKRQRQVQITAELKMQTNNWSKQDIETVKTKSNLNELFMVL